MFRLYSDKKIRKIIADNSVLIEDLCAFYHVPSAYLKSILLMELPEINVFDVLADGLVRLNWLRYSLWRCFTLDRHTRNPLRKFDSSTGYGQIFSQVAIEAILFAENEGIPLNLGISGELYPFSPDDLERVWKRLNQDRVFNLSCATLNIIHAAFQMTGRTDFDSFHEEDIKMILTRYNGNVKRISKYGEKAYRYFLEFNGSKKEKVPQ